MSPGRTMRSGPAGGPKGASPGSFPPAHTRYRPAIAALAVTMPRRSRHQPIARPGGEPAARCQPPGQQRPGGGGAGGRAGRGPHYRVRGSPSRSNKKATIIGWPERQEIAFRAILPTGRTIRPAEIPRDSTGVLDSYRGPMAR
jgi:hypothetical protein